MNTDLQNAKQHLSNLLVAVERCVYFMDGSAKRIDWPINPEKLSSHSKDIDLFEAMSAVNERFAKLQDTLASAMRHAAILAGEPTDTFLRVLAFFEKIDVLSSSEDWAAMRAFRNLAAHEYEISYIDIANHFNSLKELIPQLYRTAQAFSTYCRHELNISAASKDFTPDFNNITTSGEIKDTE
jgi:hypothetical protein